MANRWYDQFQQTLVRGLVSAFIDVQFTGAAPPVLMNFQIAPFTLTSTFAAAPAPGSKSGALTMTRSGVGTFVLTFQDKFVRVLGASATFISNTTAAAPLMQVKVASNPNAAGAVVGNGLVANNSMTLLFFSAAGVLADPAATELGIINLQLMNSTAN